MDLGVGVEKYEAMWLSHNCESISLFDCEQEEELKVGIKYKNKTFSSWDEQLFFVDVERKIEILNGYAKQLEDSRDLDIATKQIKEMIMGDSKLAAGLEPWVLKRLVNILVENNNESTKGSVAYILEFAIFGIKEKANFGIKEKTIDVLVKLMSDDSDAISIPVLRTLTRLAYFSAADASFIVESGALEKNALAVSKPVSPKRIQNLAKFLVVVVRQVTVPKDKVGGVLIILRNILDVRWCNYRCIMRACYALLYIEVEWWVNENIILNNIIDLIGKHNNMVACSALRVAAHIVNSENKNSREILTKNYKFLQYLGWSRICGKPKKFQKEACQIIRNMAANDGPSIKDLDKSCLMDALVELLELDDFDVRMGAALAIENVINYHATRDVTVS